MSIVFPQVFKKFPCLTETLTGERSPNHCQSCGRRRFYIEQDGGHLQTWIECDDYDQPSRRILKICTFCERVDAKGNPLPMKLFGKDGVIHRHARLYKQPGLNHPVPGAMPLCQRCVHRTELDCTNPQMRLNGGPGVAIYVGPPAFIDFAGGGGAMGFGRAPSKCDGFQERPTTDDDDKSEGDSLRTHNINDHDGETI